MQPGLPEAAAPDTAAEPPGQPASKPLSARKLAKFKDKVERSGIVYMSRVPPHLKPLKLRQLLEGHAKVGRIYMAPTEASQRAAQGGAKAGKSGKQYSEAWIEFEDKKAAKAVAELLNASAMGGKNRSRYHDDLWTLKYLRKFKWDHLTEEVGACISELLRWSKHAALGTCGMRIVERHALPQAYAQAHGCAAPPSASCAVVATLQVMMPVLARDLDACAAQL